MQTGSKARPCLARNARWQPSLDQKIGVPGLRGFDFFGQRAAEAIDCHCDPVFEWGSTSASTKRGHQGNRKLLTLKHFSSFPPKNQRISNTYKGVPGRRSFDFFGHGATEAIDGHCYLFSNTNPLMRAPFATEQSCQCELLDGVQQANLELL